MQTYPLGENSQLIYNITIQVQKAHSYKCNIQIFTKFEQSPTFSFPFHFSSLYTTCGLLCFPSHACLFNL